jgi:hemin uptake protein HemP
MNQSLSTDRASEAHPDGPASSTPVVESTALMSGRRELIIRHGTDSYRLRVTASNKLILTK